MRLIPRTILYVLLCLAPLVRAQKVTVSVLATTDMHGNLYPVDYYTGEPAQRGLAKLATLIERQRHANPNTLLIDCGDTIQGTPLESVYQNYIRTGHLPLGLSFPGRPPAHDPMMLAMNRLAYDSMTVGNHEFNFGLKNFNRARDDAKFPWISANVAVAPGSGEQPFPAYIVKTVAGVRIAIIGITTPYVPNWEKPENIGGYRFLPGPASVKKAVAELHRDEHPDLVLVAAHSGLDRNLTTGARLSVQDSEENIAYQIATEVPDLDALVFGHTHSQLPGTLVGKVLLVQPKNWAVSIALLDFEMEKSAAGRWTVVRKSSRLIPATAATPADEAVLAIAKPYHEVTERYLATNVAECAKTLDGALGRTRSSALVDAIQIVQRFYARADVSFASLFNTRARLEKGSVTVRQIAALYPYDNELYAVEGTGKMVKDALENSARYFLSCQGERCGHLPLTDSRVIGYNYDMADGVQYEVDLTRPAGGRVRNLTWKGKPLMPDQRLRIAVNNYRAAGSAGYSMFRDAKIVWRSTAEIRDLMIQYYSEHKELPIEPENNWHILPPAARETLERQAVAEGKRAGTM